MKLTKGDVNFLLKAIDFFFPTDEGKKRIFLLSILVIFIIIYKSWAHIKRFFCKKKTDESLMCSIRGELKTKKYDTKGNYTEEYLRVKLIDFFLKNGFSYEQIFVEYAIFFGHKGKNCMRADIVIKEKNSSTVLMVVEVKKEYNEKDKNSAINHQLLPSMKLLDCNTGLYFDGTNNSCCLLKREKKGKQEIIKKNIYNLKEIIRTLSSSHYS